MEHSQRPVILESLCKHFEALQVSPVMVLLVAPICWDALRRIHPWSQYASRELVLTEIHLSRLALWEPCGQDVGVVWPEAFAVEICSASGCSDRHWILVTKSNFGQDPVGLKSACQRNDAWTQGVPDSQ